MKTTRLQQIASHIAAGDLWAAATACELALEGETGKHWIRDLTKLAETLRDGQPRFSIFAKDGNGKLPFVAFSALPGKGFCPGAGDCLSWCYSFRAWRYPAAFARQAQNAALMHTAEGARKVLEALDAFRPADGSTVDFRLFVDGDFGFVEDVAFWMEAIAARPWLQAYGYSKSWSELLAYWGPWPTNYRLNLSGGSRHDAATKAAVAALPITRGEFVAVSVGRKVKSADHGTAAHNQRLREAYGAKAFTCPGKCGECTPKGHACGSERFRGVDIIIAVH
jgi:hypothetical protein